MSRLAQLEQLYGVKGWAAVNARIAELRDRLKKERARVAERKRFAQSRPKLVGK